MVSSGAQFDTAFPALTGHLPFRWQCRLFEQMRSGKIPRVCDLPTGLGKTSVIPVWIIALASQAQTGSTTLPRRLIYIVNRRTVVDQATSVVEQIRQRLAAPDDARWSGHEDVLGTLGEALRRLASTEDLLLAVSALRGELADNEEWKADPARPAIIIGTIDMIGSKLLFGGYGDGRYWRAQHSGLVGQDSLIIHDEAHLTPAFSDLLHRLAEVQRQMHEPRPVQVMELSATSRGHTLTALTLEREDEEDPETGYVVTKRLDAAKALHLHTLQISPGDNRADVRRKIEEKFVELGMQHRDAKAKVLIYVRSPEDAQRVLQALSSQMEKEGAQGRTALLTGTIRGHERDRLVREHPVYRALLDPNTPVDRTVYLISTSAGEVGIDIDADHMVCDLTTLDSMIQRLGRVNRRGGQGRKARVDVVVRTEDAEEDTLTEVEAALKETRVILEKWVAQSAGPLDVSTRSLRTLLDELGSDRRDKTFAPKPTVPPLTDILLDSWSLTTISRSMPGRPEVAPYLHGLSQDPPETYVVWRREVTLLDNGNVDDEALNEWFQACRPEAYERLRDRTDRVQQTLQALLTEHRRKSKDDSKDFPLVVLNERGEARRSSLSKITQKEFSLGYRTVILSVEVGGLNEQGALDAKELGSTSDVAEQVPDERRRERWLAVEGGDGTRYERLITSETVTSLPSDLKERERISLEGPTEDEEESHSRYLLLLARPRQSTIDHAETAKLRQTLDFHLNLIGDRMNDVTGALGLDGEMREALALASAWHDRGKNRPVWQRYACNPDPTKPLAKSTRYLDGRFLGGYRHEFGSLLDAAADEEIKKHPERDLILHLIAAHHGWARPHFERNAWDNSRTTAENEEAAVEAMRRFGRLQQRFGRWGLAWLESLVRCADIAASKPDAQPIATHEGVNL